MACVYILECSDGTLYTGYAMDINRRLQEHRQGTASKYTRSRLPVKLVYLEEVESKSMAMKREYAIKQMTRSQKQVLIQQAHNLPSK